ncbi:hypothetical protein [Endozoicomonas sp. GU-1]|uniref:hypothetical protein n=1 Tax=Endozoicomonas sp. GU-1 TaxID=3009078 RepID=UPI003FA477F0
MNNNDGWNGYRKGTHKKKKWLLSTSSTVKPEPVTMASSCTAVTCNGYRELTLTDHWSGAMNRRITRSPGAEILH